MQSLPVSSHSNLLKLSHFSADLSTVKLKLSLFLKVAASHSGRKFCPKSTSSVRIDPALKKVLHRVAEL